MLSRLWGSPSFTAWGSQGAASLRLVVFLPLLIRTLDEVQTASWLLFGTIVFFSNILGQQSASACSRMVAICMGGASDLAPIGDKKTLKTTGVPNWGLFSRLYRTLQSLNLVFATVNSCVSILIAMGTLPAVLRNYAYAREVWIAFGVFVLTGFVSEWFRRYAIVLRGMEKVALTNRWDALFSVASASSGAASLLLGAGIVELAIVMQCFELLKVIRLWYLLHHVVEPRCRAMSGFAWDREIFGWVWMPLWRGVAQFLANRGGVSVCTFFLARTAIPEVLTGFLLSTRLLDMLETSASVPLTSRIPKYARMLGAGAIERLRSDLVRGMRLSLFLLICGVLVLGYTIHPLIQVLKPGFVFLPKLYFLALATGVVAVTYIRHTVMIAALGNNIVCVNRFLLAVLMALAISAWLIPTSPLCGALVAAYCPVVALVNIQPLKAGSQLLETSAISLFRRTALIPGALLLLGWLPALITACCSGMCE